MYNSVIVCVESLGTKRVTERDHSQIMVDQTEQQEDGLLSAEAKPFLPQKAPAGGIPATIQEDGQQEEYTTPVVVRL